MSGIDGLGWPDESGTPETDAIVSRFRKGVTSSDGLILTMEKLERERNELRKEVARLTEWTTVNGVAKLIREVEELKAKP